MSARRISSSRLARQVILACLLVLGFSQANLAGQPAAASFRLQRVSFISGTTVLLVPDEEARRQHPVMSARLYGVASLPADDPYHRAFQWALSRLTASRPISAQVWEDGTGRVARVYAAADNKWVDVSGQLVEEGAAIPRKDASGASYASKARAAEKAKVGRYAYRHLAWFWANSTPLFAMTVQPTSGPRLPLAVAMVTPTRIEAGYLQGKSVVLLPTGTTKLQYHLVAVQSNEDELTIMTRPIARNRLVTHVWRWGGSAYQLQRVIAAP